MSASEFLASHWQKSPLFIPGAMSVAPSLTPNELAWLATQDDVESRLVFTEEGSPEHTGKTRYRVEEGPFESDQLTKLPDRNWTLLVQDVEKHLPDFRQWFSNVTFIPDWRIDDIMISFAAPGGGVGPHKDQYDVFLCQGSGIREWRIGKPGVPASGSGSATLSLLQPFTDPSAIVVSEGDVVYIPPGVPHWGIAEDECMTYSIGMRAPTFADLKRGFEREFPNCGVVFLKAAADSETFYRDPDLTDGESLPGQISTRAIERLAEQLNLDCTPDNTTLASILGCVVTDLKAWLAPEPPSSEDRVKFLEADSMSPAISVHGMSRIAWWADDNVAIAFANGRYRKLSRNNLIFFRSLCADRILTAGCIRQNGDAGLTNWLLDNSVLDL